MKITNKIDEVITEAKSMKQRAKRGYSDVDMWNLDEYIAKIVKECCFILAEECHGHPNHLTEKKWKQILLDISFGFGSYLEMRSGVYDTKEVEFNRLKKEYKKGLKIFADNHQYLWD